MWSIQIIALISAIIYWKYYKNTSQRYFLYLLIVIVFFEILATYIKEGTPYKNFPIYNLLSLFSFLFYFYWFRLVLKEKKWLKPMLVVFIISTCYSLFTQDFFYNLWAEMWYVGSVFILFNAFLYYNELLNKTTLLNYKKSAEFWVATGLLMYHVGFLPLLLFMDYYSSNHYYYRLPILILNIILYSCFIKSFLCLKPQKI